MFPPAAAGRQACTGEQRPCAREPRPPYKISCGPTLVACARCAAADASLLAREARRLSHAARSMCTSVSYSCTHSCAALSVAVSLVLSSCTAQQQARPGQVGHTGRQRGSGRRGQDGRRIRGHSRARGRRGQHGEGFSKRRASSGQGLAPAGPPAVRRGRHTLSAAALFSAALRSSVSCLTASPWLTDTSLICWLAARRSSYTGRCRAHAPCGKQHVSLCTAGCEGAHDGSRHDLITCPCAAVTRVQMVIIASWSLNELQALLRV